MLARIESQPESSAKVVVVDNEPIYRSGLAHALNTAGFQVVDPEILASWANGRDQRCLVVSDIPTANLELITQDGRGRDNGVALVLLHEVTLTATLRALRRGAVSIVDRGVTPDRIVFALEAAIRGDSVLPFTVVGDLAASMPTAPPPSDLLPRDVDLLRHLATGLSMPEIAESLYCSLRTLYRSQRNLYQRIGARNRIEAIVAATRWGLLDLYDREEI